MHWPAYTGLSSNSFSPSAAEHSLPPLSLSTAPQVLPILVDTSSAAITVCESPSCQSKSQTLFILIRISASTMLHIFPHSSSIRSDNTQRVILLLFPEVLGDPYLLLEKGTVLQWFIWRTDPSEGWFLESQISCYYLTGVKLPPFPAATSFLGYRWKKSKLTLGFLTPSAVHTAIHWTNTQLVPMAPTPLPLAPPSGTWELSGTSGITLPCCTNIPHSASRRTQSDNLALPQSRAVTRNSEKW